MADNLKGIPFSTDDEGLPFPEIAKHLVFDQARTQGGVPESFNRNDVYVVWFAYVLGAWKALCSTSVPDGRYYEVTYSREKGVAFIDTYLKVSNVEVSIV